MARKLRVIEGDRLAPVGGKGASRACMAWAISRGGRAATMALMEGQDGLAVDPEQHQVGLPVTGGAAIRDGARPLGQRAAQGDEGRPRPLLRRPRVPEAGSGARSTLFCGPSAHR